MKTNLNRRRFLSVAAMGAAAVAVPTVMPGRVLGLDGAVSPANRITIAGLGIGSRGNYVMSVMFGEPELHFLAIADVQKGRRLSVKKRIDDHNKNEDCAMYRDMEEMLARPDIDAVLIATGDRWHTMATIMAAKAGKDIYCEKPCSLTIEESLMLADTVDRYGRIYQAGTQRRSIENFQTAIRMAQTGKLGKLTEVHANTLGPGTRHNWLEAQPEPDPDDCDWERWLGGCPWRPFNQTYVNGGWRGHYDFHGGGILEWGSHTIDLCQIANQADDTVPVRYVPNPGGGEAYYQNGVKLVMRDHGWLGLGTCSVRFVGTDGWVETGDSGRMMVGPESLLSENKVCREVGTSATSHVKNFIHCVKTRQTTRSNPKAVAQSHIASHAAYIAWQLNTELEYNPFTNEFRSNAEANRMRSRALRDPWHF